VAGGGKLWYSKINTMNCVERGRCKNEDVSGDAAYPVGPISFRGSVRVVFDWTGTERQEKGFAQEINDWVKSAFG